MSPLGVMRSVYQLGLFFTGQPEEPETKQSPKKRKLEDQDKVLSNKEKDDLTTKQRCLYNTKYVMHA